jgi:hypothetical protein
LSLVRYEDVLVDVLRYKYSHCENTSCSEAALTALAHEDLVDLAMLVDQVAVDLDLDPGLVTHALIHSAFERCGGFHGFVRALLQQLAGAQDHQE